jgi:ribose transport system permease protein
MADTLSPTEEYTGAIATNAAGSSRRDKLGRFGARFSVIGVWLAFAILFSALLPQLFPTEGTFRTIFGSQQNMILVFLAAALLCTIVVGEFVDLSIVGNFALSAILLSVLHVDHDVNVWLAIVVALAVATAAGALNGFLVVKLGVNTIVVTLGMNTFLIGIAQWASNMVTVSGLPTDLSKIVLFQIGVLPIGFFYGLLLMLVFAYVLGFTPLGRNMRFVGENREVSRLAGVRVNRIRIGAFTTAGLLAGLAGVLSASATGGFDQSAAMPYMLPVFAATFLGTAILQPGRFNPLGTLIAVYFLATGVIGLQMLGASAWVTNVFYGGVLVIAVTISTIIHARAK